MKLFNFSAQVYTDARNINLDKNCNALTVINKGSSEITFNGVPLAANEHLTIGGNAAEILAAPVMLSFSGAGICKAVVIQKYYVS